MYASGDFGIRKNKVVRSSEIIPNKVDNTRDYIISFSNTGSSTPTYSIYTFDNIRVGEFALNTSDFHPSNDYLTQAEGSNDLYLEEEGSLITLVRVFHELTPFTGSSDTYYNAFVKVDFDFENVSVSTYSIIGYYGTTGSAVTGTISNFNAFLHHYDEPNNDIYMSTGSTSSTAFFRQIDIASYSQVVSKSLTASGYAYFIDYDEMTNSSEVRLVDSPTLDKNLKNFRYEWDNNVITESATAGNSGAIFKHAYGYVEVDTSNSPTVSLILQDFDCNDLELLAEEGSLIATPSNIESTDIKGGRLFSDNLEFLAIDSATANTGLYNLYQKTNDKIITSGSSKLEIVYTETGTKVNDGDILVDKDRGFIYTFNSGFYGSSNGETVSIRQHDLDFNFISEFNPTSSIVWGSNFVAHNWVEETHSKMFLPLNSNSSDRAYILDINFEDFSQSSFIINATATSYSGVVTGHYYDSDNNFIYYSDGQFNITDLRFRKLNLITASYSVNYNTNLLRHMGGTFFDPLREEVFGQVSVSNGVGKYASFSYDSLTYSETSGNFPARGADIIDINENVITITYEQENPGNDIFYDEVLNNDSLTSVSSISIDPGSTLKSVSVAGDRNTIYAFDETDLVKIIKTNGDDKKGINSNCAYLEEIISGTFTGVTGGIFIGASTESEYFYVTNTNNNSGDDLTIYQYDFDFNLVDSWDTTYTTTRYTTNFIWDEDEKTFWVVASENSFSLVKFKINETTLSSTTTEEDIDYVFPSGYAAGNTRNAFLRETQDDIIFSLSGTDNGINNVYYVDKVGATTSNTIDLSGIADSFLISDATYVEDFNVSFINTVGFGLTGSPRLTLIYKWNDDSVEILLNDSDNLAYYLSDYITTKLQEVLYVDTGDIVHLEVINFRDEVTYSDIPSVITVNSVVHLTKLRDGRILYISSSDGEGTLFRLQNSILESGDCNPIEEQDLGRPMILEMQTNGSNQIGVNTSILGGAGDQIIRWGDGTSDTYMSTGIKTHTYDAPGTYDVRIYGNMSRIDLLATGFETNLLAIKQWGDVNMSAGFRFQNCSNMEAKYTDSPTVAGSLQNSIASCPKFNGKVDDWDMSNVTNTSAMFANDIIFNQPINSWDVSNVTNMSTMFFNCPEFNQPLDNWDVSSVQFFTNFLNGADKFNQPLNNWDMSSAVVLDGMFNNCSSFNQPLDNWDVSNVTLFRNMFRDCAAFDQPLNKWNTSKAIDMANMFTRSVFNQPIGDWDTSQVTSFALMFFQNTVFNQPINSWDTGSVSNMGSMFSGADSFNQDLDEWDTSSLTVASNLFSSADDFNGKIYNWDLSGVNNMASMLRNTSFSGTVSEWDVSNVTNMSTVFFRCSDFNDNINSWTVSSVQNMANLFYEASSFNQPLDNWDVSDVTDFRTMFRITPFNQDISGWDTTSAIFMSQMFVGATQFNQDISSWTVSKVTTFDGMFNGALAFNQPLDSWDVSQATDMDTMFFNTSMDQDLNSWDTGSVSSMVNMFAQSDFNGTISNWDVSNVESMQSMFSSTPFDKDISNWDVSKVENMQSMFSGTPFNQDISGWTVSSVTNMRRMFNANNEFDQDISGWDINQVTDFLSFRFTVTGGSFSVANYDAILIAWEAQAPQTGIDISFGASKFTTASAAAAARESLIATYSWTIDDGGST